MGTCRDEARYRYPIYGKSSSQFFFSRGHGHSLLQIAMLPQVQIVCERHITSKLSGRAMRRANHGAFTDCSNALLGGIALAKTPDHSCDAKNKTAE
jgi:hypothetical protein